MYKYTDRPKVDEDDIIGLLILLLFVVRCTVC